MSQKIDTKKLLEMYTDWIDKNRWLFKGKTNAEIVKVFMKINGF